MIPFLDPILKIVEKIIPDPQARDAAKLELLKLQQEGEFRAIEIELQAQLAQIEVNKVEAASSNPFVSGWRPAVGWVGVIGLLYTFLLRPLITFVAAIYGFPPAPEIDITELMVLVTGLLGFGGLRSWERHKGVARE